MNLKERGKHMSKILTFLKGIVNLVLFAIGAYISLILMFIYIFGNVIYLLGSYNDKKTINTTEVA